MRPRFIYECFLSMNRDLVPELRRYTQDNSNANAIKLEFRDGRKGRFEVQRGRYILEIESKED